MGVYKREYMDEKGNPVWYFIFPHNGRRYRQSGYTTKRQAEMAEAKRRHEVMFEGKVGSPSVRTTFADVLPKYLEYREKTGMARTTVQGERSRTRPLLRFFGKMRISVITSKDVMRYIELRRNDGNATRTVNLELVLLRTLFAYAINQQLVNANPMDTVKDLKRTDDEKAEARRRLDCLASTDLMGRLLSAALKTSTGYQLYTWMMLMAYTGPRPSEAFRLEWSDVNFDEGCVSYWSRKTVDSNGSEKRKVPMQPELKDVLLNWREIWTEMFKGSPLHNRVFFVPRQPKRRAVSFDKCWEQARTDAGMEDFRPYDFRHYFISRALMSDVDMLTVSRWVNTSVAMISKVYAHLIPEFHQAEMAKVKIV